MRPLSGDFKFIKEHIQQTIADMLTDIKTLMDIQDFQKALNTAFKEKGALTIFKNQVVKSANKNISANKAGVEKEAKKDGPENLKKFRDELSNKKIPHKEDTDLKREAATIASKLCDESNKDNEVRLHKDIEAFQTAKNKRLCWKCLSANCLTKLKLCKKFNMTKNNEHCRPVNLTFEKVGEFLKNIPKPKPATSEDEDHEDIGDIIGKINRREEHKNLNYGYNDKESFHPFS